MRTARAVRLVARRAALTAVMLAAWHATTALAHPLGNFSINHYARIRAHADHVTIRYVVDMAEIATFQEIAANGGTSTSWPEAARSAYLERTTTRLVQGLALTVDDAPVRLRAAGTSLTTPAGLGGQPTLRLEIDVVGSLAAVRDGARFAFEDGNHPGRTGWRELVVEAGAGVEIFDSSAFADDLSDELHRYPNDDQLVAPLQERHATWSLTSGEVPAGARRPARRPEAPVERRGLRARLADLVTLPLLTSRRAVLGLLAALILGGIGAFDTAVVARPRRSTATRLILGVQTTTAELGRIMPLAIVALIGASYLVPERLRPIVTILSGAGIALCGLGAMLRRRSRPASSSLPGAPLVAVMLAGVAFHDVGYGFALILAFGSGLLAVLLLPLDPDRAEALGAAPFAWLTRACLIIGAGGALVINALGNG